MSLKLLNPEDGRETLCDNSFEGWVFPLFIEVEHRTTGFRSYVGQIKSNEPKMENRVGFVKRPSGNTCLACHNPADVQNILDILSIAYGKSFAFFPISAMCFAG